MSSPHPVVCHLSGGKPNGPNKNSTFLGKSAALAKGCLLGGAFARRGGNRGVPPPRRRRSGVVLKEPRPLLHFYQLPVQSGGQEATPPQTPPPRGGPGPPPGGTASWGLGGEGMETPGARAPQAASGSSRISTIGKFSLASRMYRRDAAHRPSWTLLHPSEPAFRQEGESPIHRYTTRQLTKPAKWQT